MIASTIRGSVFKLGDSLNTDVIIAGRHLIHVDPEVLAQHAFEVLGKDFAARLRQFDILVAGANFGCGSAREQAVTTLQGLGIQAVVAGSFARTFYRNAINRGLPIVECAGLGEAVEQGDEIEIDLEAARITTPRSVFSFPPLPESIAKILQLGGLTAYLRSQIETTESD